MFAQVTMRQIYDLEDTCRYYRFLTSAPIAGIDVIENQITGPASVKRFTLELVLLYFPVTEAIPLRHGELT